MQATRIPTTILPPAAHVPPVHVPPAPLPHEVIEARAVEVRPTLPPVLAVLALVLFVLTGCGGMANGASDATFCVGALPTEYQAAAVDAADEWNATVGTALAVDADPECASAREPARTFVASVRDMSDAEGRTIFTRGAGANELLLRPGFSEDRARLVILHEMGHALGLEHSESRTDVMYFSAATKARHLSAGDVAAYERIAGAIGGAS